MNAYLVASFAAQFSSKWLQCSSFISLEKDKQEGEEEEDEENNNTKEDENEDEEEGELLDRLEESFTRSDISRNQASRRVEIMKRNISLYDMQDELHEERVLAMKDDGDGEDTDTENGDDYSNKDERGYIAPHDSYRLLLERMSHTIEQSQDFTSRRERATRAEITNLVKCLKDYDTTHARLETRAMCLEERRHHVFLKFLSSKDLSLTHISLGTFPLCLPLSLSHTHTHTHTVQTHNEINNTLIKR